MRTFDTRKSVIFTNSLHLASLLNLLILQVPIVLCISLFFMVLFSLLTRLFLGTWLVCTHPVSIGERPPGDVKWRVLRAVTPVEVVPTVFPYYALSKGPSKGAAGPHHAPAANQASRHPAQASHRCAESWVLLLLVHGEDNTVAGVVDHAAHLHEGKTGERWVSRGECDDEWVSEQGWWVR